MSGEAEWKTRKKRIDPKLDAAGWPRPKDKGIPDLEFIVFLRAMKSRILFEQMLGRGTRKGERCPDKDHFTVFDCFDGSLLDYFRNATGITAVPPVKPTRTIVEIIEDIWANRDRDYNTRCLVKRLQRIDKSMAGDPNHIVPMYLAMQLACRRTYDSILAEVHGATRARITTRQLGAIRIPVRSLTEQAAMVKTAVGLFAIAKAVESRAAIVDAAVRGLPHAILAKAFSGELVPTDAELARNHGGEYEPASALLARLAQPTATTAKPERKKRADGKRVAR